VPYNPKRTLIPGRGPLARVPPIVAFLLVVALFGLGVWLRGPVGALLLGVLVLGVTALLVATWRLLDTGARVLRVVVVVVLVAIAISVVPG
jgi:hypothetical protein